MKIIFGALLLVCVGLNFWFESRKWKAKMAFPQQASRARWFFELQIGAWALALLCSVFLTK